jgi:rare lipoprotein A
MRKMEIKRAGATLRLLALIAPVAYFAAGCAGPPHRGGSPNWRERGLASWYGADFHGRRTANGERYNMYAMTAAHKTLPLGTWVEVTHLETGRRIRVRVNDRGPFVGGRVIDLSLAAARALGSVERGIVPVLVEADLPGSAFADASAGAGPVGPPAAGTHPPPLRGTFAVQVGSFMIEENARRLAGRLPVPPEAAQVLLHEDNRGAWWRVRIGGYASETEAEAAAAALGELGLDGFVVRED